MPQVSLTNGLAALIVILALTGCSDPRSESFNTDTGKHIAGWLPAQHATYATNGTTSMGAPIPSTGMCTECHGDDLAGGISGVSCSSCHLGGPTAVHPLSWDPIYLTHGPSVSSGATTTASCANQYCHGTNLGGVANSGPSCTSCHSMPFNPATVTCGACHSIPPDGTRFPDLAGKHAKHATSATTSCNICHNGASGYVGDHHNGIVDLIFLPTYAPKSGGTPTYNTATGTCSNVRCHGGPRTQTAAQAIVGGGNPASAQSTTISTPSWKTGALNVNTQCTACHVYGNVEFNSYSSGHHYFHVWDPNNGPSPNGQNPKVACTVCHDTAKLSASHFTSLSTTAMEGPASATILNSLNYNSPSPGSCTPSCHGTETW